MTKNEYKAVTDIQLFLFEEFYENDYNHYYLKPIRSVLQSIEDEFNQKYVGRTIMLDEQDSTELTKYKINLFDCYYETSSGLIGIYFNY